MSDILVYKNKFWKALHDFRYTGSPQKVTLEPGEYLFVCNGANGGACIDSSFQNPKTHGGTAYGILNLSQTKDFYAIVGGDGGDGSILEQGAGGYNGGGTGGLGFSDGTTTYSAGGGGGGASDVRLINPDQTEPIEIVTRYSIPEEYQAIEYLESTYDRKQWIDTQYIHNTFTNIECMMYAENDRTHYNYETVFGARKNTYSYNAFYLFITNSGRWDPRWTRTGQETSISNFPYNTKISVENIGNILNVYNETKDTLLTTVTGKTNDDGVCTMLLFNLNTSSSVVPKLYSNGNGGSFVGKIYSFKIYENGVLLHYFMPVRRKTESFTIDIDPLSFEQGTIGSSGDDSSSTRVRTKEFFRADNFKGTLTFEAYDTDDNPLELCVSEYSYDNKSSTYLIEDGNWISAGGSYTFTSEYTSHIRFILKKANGSSSINPSNVKSLRITVSNCNAGMYDVMTQTFHANRSLHGDFVRGEDIESTGYEEIFHSDTSTFSRIIVGAGAGGVAAFDGTTNSHPSYFGIGGGAVGSPVSSNPTDKNYGKCAKQDQGFSLGTGMSPPAKTAYTLRGAEGAGGGGGGWFGGYSSAVSNLIDSSSNGGGGSSYVLTEDSYKPTGYEEYVSSDYYFTDTVMTGGTADHSSVTIYRKVFAPTSGDKLVFPCVGWTESFYLNKGNYTIKCVGGDGGIRYITTNIAHGGYSEGVLSLEDRTPVFVTVGGSGIRYAFSYQDAIMCNPTMAFNGGGNAGDANDIRSSFGGGGTDVRLLENTLYNRLIVAGGAAGHGAAETAYTQYGGHGGGETGGNSRYGKNYGTTPGPGTQTASPQGSDVGGGFGYGGQGRYRSSGFGGAGGGGWYGGSGCYPNSSSDDDKGGCGGSGYVLTEDSYKPDGYALGEEYYLTNAFTSSADESHAMGQTYVEILVNESQNKKILCYDAEGTKTFDPINNEWVYVSSGTPTQSDFDQYGVYKMETDEGLLNEYSIYAYDDSGIGTSYAILNVIPPKQTIIGYERTPNMISETILDCDVDENVVDLSISTDKAFIAGQNYAKFTIDVNIASDTDKPTKFYNILTYSEGVHTSYHLPDEQEHAILPKADLLSVGIGDNMPSRFKPYIGDSLDGGTAITEISSSITCEHNRNIYSAVLCNNSVVRFTKLNLVTNTSTIIRDVPKSSLGDSYIGGLLVDDNYMYLASSAHNTFRKLWRIPLDPTEDRIVELSAPSDLKFTCFGKIAWYNYHTILINHRRRGYWLLDTETLKWENYQCPTITDDEREDFVIGNKYMITTYNGSSRTAWIVDIETNTWYDIAERYYQFQESSRKCVDYGDGKFYFAQPNYIYIIDEEDLRKHLEEDVSTEPTVRRIPSAYGSLVPRTINYAPGFLYITTSNANSLLYIYDIAKDIFRTEYLGFTNSSWQSSSILQPIVCYSYYFIGHLKLYVINCSDYCKYNIGYKYDIMYVPMNEGNESKFEYDERFVSFHDSYILVSDGDITKLFEPVNENMARILINKSEYNKFNNLFILDEDEDEG